jgi:hypothetical protein
MFSFKLNKKGFASLWPTFPKYSSGHSEFVLSCNDNIHFGSFHFLSSLCIIGFLQMMPTLILFALLSLVSNINAQDDSQKLSIQQQTAFCQLWLESNVERQHSLDRLCFRLAKRYSNAVINFCCN